MPNVLVDNTGQSTGGTSTASISISSFAVGSGASRYIHLVVSQYSTTDRVPTATFNGSESFVFHDEVTIAESPGVRRVTVLRLVAPSNTTANIVVSWSGTVNEVVVGATSWSVVNQTTPLGTAVKNSGSSGSTATSSVVIPNANGDAVHDGISADGASGVSGTANQTSRWNAVAASNTTDGAGQSAAGAGTDITCTWTSMGSPGGTIYAHIGVAIQQDTGGAAAAVVAPLLSTAMRPTSKGLRGKVAMAMRALRPPQVPVIGAAFNDSVAETGSAADSETATADFSVARAEAVTAADSSTGALTAVVAAAETLAAADTETGALTTAGSVAETLSAADTETGALVAATARTETLSATDAQDASVTGAGDAVTESLTATATQSATVVFASAATDTLTAADAETSTFITSAAVAEAVIITDSELGTVATLALIAEILALADVQDATIPGAFALVRGPLYIDFDDIVARVEFDDLATQIRFLSLNGEEIMGPLKLYEGEVVDVQFVLKGAGDVPQDLSAASSIKWTVGNLEDAPADLVLDEAPLVVVAPATNGRVKYSANAALTAAGGRYKSLAVATFPGSPPIVRKFPGDVIIESAIV